MPDPIYLPDQTIRPQVRWYEIVAQNPADGAPLLTASAEVLRRDVATSKVIGKERAPQYDLTIPFDPTNAKHLAIYAAIDELLRSEYQKLNP